MKDSIFISHIGTKACNGVRLFTLAEQRSGMVVVPRRTVEMERVAFCLSSLKDHGGNGTARKLKLSA